MFKHLFDLGHPRTAVQAVGFYIAYLVLLVLVAALIGGIAGMLIPNLSSFAAGARVGAVVAIIACVIIALLILKRKKLLGNFGLILLAVLTGFLAMVGGGLLGLIVPAYLTTVKPHGHAHHKKHS